MEPQEITIDPDFQGLIPPLTPRELSQLEENLVDNGCREPLAIWYERPECPCGGEPLWQGGGLFQCDACGKGLAASPVLLDGHNRLGICAKHGLQFDIFVVPDLEDRTAAKAWVIRNQLGRRNLNESQRAMLAKTLKDIFARQAKQRQAEQAVRNLPQTPKVANLPPLARGKARDEAADAMGVSPRLVDAAEKVQTAGSEKLQQAVMAGQASVSAAAEVAALPMDQQDKAVAAGKKGVAAAAKKVRQARRPKGGISPDALTPVRGHSRPAAKTALELPHDPVWAAKALISTFDREFLVGLVSEITRFLKGDGQ